MANRVLFRIAVLTLLVGGFVDAALSQDTRPSADSIAERMRARGIQISPEQIERARKIMEDMANGVQPDPEQIKSILGDVRKQAQTRVKETLGATDEEWQVLGPKVEKVQNLLLQNENTGMMLSRFGLGNINPGGGEQSEVQKKLQALQDLLKNKEAKVEEITAAMTEYRAAKVKAKADLEKARAELKELVTVKQEAQLMTMGLLE